MVQLLTPEGERVPHPDYDAEVADIGPAELRGFYRDLVLARRFDIEATALQRQGELGLWTASLGQEAAQIGSVRATRATDHLFPSYREHGVVLTRGIDPVDVLRLFRGQSGAGWDPADTRTHIYTLVLGSQLLHATGYAMGIQKDGAIGDEEGEAVIAYFGDGASSQGDVSEAFVWASVYASPVVFFCQNNQWAISTPVSGQLKIPLYQRAAGFGFPGVQVDGNDVLAVLAVTRRALRNARTGQGPTLIEAFTYRMGAHSTSDDPTRYRLSAELETWKLRDPVERIKAHLTRAGELDTAFTDQLEADSDALAAHIRAGCLGMQDPPGVGMFDVVYDETTPLLREQQEFFEDYHSGFAESH
jgi:2-oxoisovalerate dehydrogenase E1 component alpha subunit